FRVFEAGGFGGNRVHSGRNASNDVVSRFVRLDLALQTPLVLIFDNDPGIRNSAAAWVFEKSGNRAQVRLSEPDRNKDQQHKRELGYAHATNFHAFLLFKPTKHTFGN